MPHPNIDTYSQKEIALDAVTLTGVTVATSLANKVHLVNPLSVGTLVLTGANILALTATKKLLDHKQIESKFLRACTIITALALTTLAIPLAIGTLCGASIAVLSFEVAIQTTLLHLATKVATYGLFRGGLLFKNFFFFSFPTSIHEITSLPQSQLEQVKAHLLDFPGKAMQIPLLFQLTLNQQLREHNLEPLPLKNFSERGENWTRNQLKELHGEDLRHLPLEKRAAVAELFFYHNFPPQGRPYEKDELPSIDYGVLDKKLNASQLIWVHLIARLDPQAPLYEPVLKQFYRLTLTPPRSSWIDLPQPTSVSEIQNLKASQIQWYANLFEAQRVKWESLPIPLQEAFNVRFATKRPIYGTAVKEVPSLQEVPSLLGQVKKAITWKRVAIAGGALAVTALIAAYYFRPELFHGSGGEKIVELATTPSTPPPAPYLDPSRIAVSANNFSLPEQPVCPMGEAPLPKPLFPVDPSPIVSARNLSASEPSFCLPGDAPPPPDPAPFTLPENLPPSEPSFCPSNHTPASTLTKTAEIGQTHFEPRIVPEVPSHISLSSRISDFARTAFHLGKFALPGALLPFIYWGLRYCMRPDIPEIYPAGFSEEDKELYNVPPESDDGPLLLPVVRDQPADPAAPAALEEAEEEDVPAIPPVGADEAALVVREEEKEAARLGIEVPGEGRYAIDLSDPAIRELFKEYLRQIAHLPRTEGDVPNPIRVFLNGGILTLSHPRAISLCYEFIQQVQQTTEIPALLPPAAIEEEPVAIERREKELDWPAIRQYVTDHCPGVDPAEAQRLILEGITLIQKLHRSEPEEQTDPEHKLVAVCWGLMAHSITKGHPFTNGTFDISDPGHRIFRFFLPILYGRLSSHYVKRIIKFDDGYWRGYGHFGFDVNAGELPAGKRTVLLGRIQTLDDSKRTYFKMEDWGANFNFRTDRRALPYAPHILGHTFGFLTSQAQRKLPVIFGEVGQGSHARKEHMPIADARRISALIQRAREADASLKAPTQTVLKDYGFQVAVRFLKRCLTNTKLPLELRQEITAYLTQLQGQYDHLDCRTGNETNVNASICEYVASSSSSSHRPEEEEEES